MITIHAWQWDTDIPVRIPYTGTTAPELDFMPDTGTGQTVRPELSDGILTAQCPPQLLTSSRPIQIYARLGNTIDRVGMICIRPRPKPPDYIDTPEAVRTWEELAERITQLEEDQASGGTVSDEQIAAAVDAYMQENPVSGGTVATVEPAEDDIPKVFISGVKPTTKDDVLAEMQYNSKTDSFHAYLTIKCQGTSSMSYPKKNFTVKLYSDEARETKLKKDFKDWNHPGNKFVLKANYIDHSHARNIISARLWNEVVMSRHDYESLPEEMRNSPRNGAVDGFPVKLYYNGTYEGIYTWNIGKDDWMWGMDEDNPNHVLLCAETNTDGVYRATPCNFRALWNGVDETDWSVEVGTNSTALKTSINNLIQFVMDNDGEAFRSGIGNYLDIQSAIDYYIFQYEVCGLDGLAKNMLLATYDGTIWRCGAYDLDSTFGLWWNGTKFVSATYACPEDYQEEFSLLWERIEANYLPELKARQAELRKTVLSYSNMVTHFERFMDTIGLDLYAEDLTIYTGIPCGLTNNIKQIRNYIRDRQAYVDAEFAAMTDPVPCTGITLSASELTFTAEGTQTMTATVTPDGCTDTVVWSVDDSSVATVNGGVVTAIANGSATITATCGAYSATCAVAVSGIEEYVPGELPAEYTQLQYIESTGTQYIDTGVSGGTNAAYEIQLNTLGTKASTFEHYFAGEKDNDTPKLYANALGTIAQIKDVTGVSCFGNTYSIHTVSYNLDGTGNVYVDGSETATLTANANSGWGEYTWYVCSGHEEILPSTMRLYYLKMWADGAIVRDFVPALRNSDSVAGLFDLANGKFYENIGTGSFGYPTQSESVQIYSLEEETTFNGTSDYVDTGVELFDENKDFTIAIEFTGNGTSPSLAGLFHCVKEVNPWPGIAIDIEGNLYRFYDTQRTNIAATDTNKHRIVAVKNAEAGTIYLYWDVISNVLVNSTPSITIPTFYKTLVLGAKKQDDGTIANYWGGTIHNCYVYNYQLDPDDIAAYLNG